MPTYQIIAISPSVSPSAASAPSSNSSINARWVGFSFKYSLFCCSQNARSSRSCFSFYSFLLCLLVNSFFTSELVPLRCGARCGVRCARFDDGRRHASRLVREVCVSLDAKEPRAGWADADVLLWRPACRDVDVRIIRIVRIVSDGRG